MVDGEGGKHMKRLYLVESDTAYYALFAYELEELGDGLYRRVGTDSVVCESSREQFFGAVSSGLVTRREVESPKPMTLTPPPKPIVSRNKVDGSIAEAERAVERVVGPRPPAYDSAAQAAYANYASDGTFSDGAPVVEPEVTAPADDSEL